jgi:hypothetical protein
VLPLLAGDLFKGIKHGVAHLLGRKSCCAGFGDIGGARACGQRRSIMATLRMEPSGLAMPLPAMSGALPWTGS